jgi:hypothetical protein
MQALAEPFIFRYLRFSSLDAVQRAAHALEDSDASRKVSQWTRTLRFMLSSTPRSEKDPIAEYAATIISHSRALVELDAWFLWVPTEGTIAAAVEAAAGTLRCLKLAFAQDMSPAFWAAVGTVVCLRSLHLHAVSIHPFTDWEAVGSWDLPHLTRLTLDLDRYSLPEHYNGIFAFLERCSFPGLQELDICTPDLESLVDAPAMGRFLTNYPALIRLAIVGPLNLSSDVIQRASAEIVTLCKVPDASAVASLSSGIFTLNIRTAPHKEDEARVLALLEALINSRPRDSRLEYTKLDFWDANSMRLEILPFAQRLHEQGITLLDAIDQRYYV